MNRAEEDEQPLLIPAGEPTQKGAKGGHDGLLGKESA